MSPIPLADTKEKNSLQNAMICYDAFPRDLSESKILPSLQLEQCTFCQEETEILGSACLHDGWFEFSGPGMSASLLLLPTSIVEKTSASKVFIQRACKFHQTVEDLKAANLAESCNGSDGSSFEIDLHEEVNADELCAALLQSIALMCSSLFSAESNSDIASSSETPALPPSTGKPVVCADVLYRIAPQQAHGSTEAQASPVFSIVFAEVCSSIAPAGSPAAHGGIIWPSLRLYTDATKKDCLETIAVGPGSSIVHHPEHPSLCIQERLLHVLAFANPEQAGAWARLLSALCGLDPMDSTAVSNSSSEILDLAKSAADIAVRYSEKGKEYCLPASFLRLSTHPPLPYCDMKVEEPQQRSETLESNSEGFDVAAALQECGNLVPQASDTCRIVDCSETCEIVSGSIGKLGSVIVESDPLSQSLSGSCDSMSASCDSTQSNHYLALNILYGRA